MQVLAILNRSLCSAHHSASCKSHQISRDCQTNTKLVLLLLGAMKGWWRWQPARRPCVARLHTRRGPLPLHLRLPPSTNTHTHTHTYHTVLFTQVSGLGCQDGRGMGGRRDSLHLSLTTHSSSAFIPSCFPLPYQHESEPQTSD